MPRLPPAEKLPLAVRKDIRDNWEAKKEEHEQALSEILGQPWTINIDPKAIWPYADDGSWAKTSTGDMLSSYLDGAKDRLKDFINTYGDEGKDEINTIASAHTILMDLDEKKKNYYCGVDISDAGELVLLFTEGNLGVNIGDTVAKEKLEKALNEATPSEDAKPMSYFTRTGIREEYTTKIEPVQEKLNKLLGKEIPLEPGFEELYAKLKSSSNASDGWEKNMGYYLRLYFEGLNDYLEREKFGEDDMLQEGLTEALEGNAVRFRVVDKLTKGYYNEPLIEDGVLYLQCTPDNFGTNVSQIADKLIDQL